MLSQHLKTNIISGEMLENPGTSPDDIGKVTFVRHESSLPRSNNDKESGQTLSANCDQNHNEKVNKQFHFSFP